MKTVLSDHWHQQMCVDVFADVGESAARARVSVCCRRARVPSQRVLSMRQGHV